MREAATSRRRFLQAVGAGGLTVSATGIASAERHPRNFRAHLVGENQEPPVETDAQGQAVFQLSGDGDELAYKLIVANIEDVLMAHIHVVDPDDDVVVWLYPSSPPPQLIPGRSDGVLAEGTITDGNLVGPLSGGTMDDLVSEIDGDNAYVNVHTSDNPGGEIRGPIR